MIFNLLKLMKSRETKRDVTVIGEHILIELFEMMLTFDLKIEGLEKSIKTLDIKVDKIDKNISNIANYIREVLGTDRKKTKPKKEESISNGEKYKEERKENKKEEKKTGKKKN